MNIQKTLFAAMMLAGASVAYAANPKPFTVPEVASWKGGDGSFVPAAASTRIVADPKKPEVIEIARQLGQDYTTLTGTELPVVAEKAKKGDISLQLKKAKKGENNESYTIEVTPKGVVLSAPTAEGLYWATRTLLQMTENSESGLALPVGTVNDAPQYAWRGFLLDTGRKFIPLDYIYALINTMSYYKMNTLHIHLNDNAFPYYFDNDWDKTPWGFRMESDKFPGLTSRDGSYTKQEFRDLIKYAKSKGIEILPEFDIPAHSLAFTQYIPEIASTGRNGRDHLDITNPKTYEFIDTLLAEYIGGDDPVFSGPLFHIGTDEYQGDSLTMEQFRGFTDYYIKYVEKLGKKPVIWGSLTHAKGQTPVQSDNVLMYAWSNGYANPRDMIDQGYELISIPDGWTYIVPSAGYYYDYLNTKALYENWTPATIGNITFSADTAKQKIRGGMFAVWNDHPNNGLTVKDIAHRVKHALPTMAAKTWSANEVSVPYDEFIARSSKMIEAPGVNFLSRQGTPGEVSEVLALDVVKPGSKLPLEEIGYDYTVEFTIDGANEAKGTKLFEGPNSTFWLSDPIEGKLGYSREGHLNTFRYDVRPGEKLNVKITGDNKGTKLYVNGKLIDDMNIRWVSYNMKNKMAQVRTLVFPLAQTGKFNSKITNLKVTNAIK